MTIRWGIIGCGDIARKRVAAAIQNQNSSDLVAAAGRNQEKLTSFCRDFGIPRSYDSPEQLLESPEIDAIYLATPPHLHAAHSCAASKAGKHVLVEKPMAMSVEECDAMLAAAAASQTQLAVAYYRRLYPVMTRLETLITTDVLGQPLAISAVTSNGFGLGADATGWRGDSSIAGGGALMDIGSHRIDLFVKLFGNAQKVSGIANQIGVTYETENVATVVMEFTQGVQATLQTFFGTEVGLDQFRCVGTRGQIDIEDLNSGQMTVSTATRTWQESHPPADNLHGPLIDDFVDAIENGRPPACDGSQGRETNRIMALAYQTAQT